MATTAQHQAAKKNMTKGEFKLFSESFPKQLQTLSRRRVQSALKKTEELVEKYRKSLMTASKENMRTLDYRLKNLEKTLNRYSQKLKDSGNEEPTKAPRKKASSSKTSSSSASKKASRSTSREDRRSVTSQPKLRLNRRGDSTRNYRYEERQHKYDMHSDQPRPVTLASSTKKKIKKNASSRLMKKPKSNRRPTGRDARIQH